VFALCVQACASEPSGAATENQELVLDDAGYNDNFGAAVSISGDTLVVGAQRKNVGGVSAGAVYIFEHVGDRWLKRHTLAPPDAARGDGFGRSVAIDGDTIIVGASNKMVGGNAFQGTAYVFVRGRAGWSLQQELAAEDGVPYDYFGYSAAISGDTVIVGAHNDTVANDASVGAVYVFTRDRATWSLQQKLMGAESPNQYNFARSIALDGDTAVVGASEEVNEAKDRQGAAYVFVRAHNSWSLQQRLEGKGEPVFAEFGISVAVSGDTIIVGDDTYDTWSRGAAYVYVRKDERWVLEKRLFPHDRAKWDGFGSAVSVSEDIALIGASSKTVNENGEQGAAYFFVRSEGTWSQRLELTASDGAMTDLFGSAVSVNGRTAVVGAGLASRGNNEYQGAAFVFATPQ
jgi:hypothetical protein